MSDFLDRFGAQLVAAEERLGAQPEPAVPTVAVRSPRRWRSRRGLVVAFAALVVAVPALAATQPWDPILGRPGAGDEPAGVAVSAPPAVQSGGLAVLRRPQNGEDRGPVAQQLLASVGSEYKGVRVSSIRLLTAAGGQHALLVPTEAHGRSSTPGAYETSNRLCLETGKGGFCGDGKNLVDGDLLGGSDDNLFGLVPDGVAKVTMRFPGGEQLSAAVQENFFWITGVPSDGHARPTITWLDDSGRRVGPSGALGG